MTVTYGDTILINGTDVYDLPGVFAVDLIDGIRAPGTRRGDDDPVGNRDGVVRAALPLDRYLITIPLFLGGATTAASNANLAAFGPLVNPPGTKGLVTLTRKLANGSGGFDSHTCNARFATCTYLQMNHTDWQVDLQFYNTDGAWFNGSAMVYP